jgi:transglutaminase-like putative cysteine protease
MKRYRIVHTTGFKYSGLVVTSYNEARMLPARDEHQLVFASKLDITPGGSSHEYADYFGTRTMFFEVLEPHNELTITSTSLVEARSKEQKLLGANMAFEWASLPAAIETSLSLTDAVANTRRTNPPAELAKAAKKFAADLSPYDAALALMKFIHSKMTYLHGETGVHSVATEAWSKKVGVCQDFTHLALGALRSIGIPARYVSGYLHPSLEPEVGLKVIGESHAWVEFFAGSWIGFDPTNDVFIEDRHIVVARGRDYDDVAPLRGVYAGSTESELFVSVEITREA